MVHLDTGRVPLHVGVGHDSLVVQIAEGHIERGLVRETGVTCIVFLPQGVPVGGVGPVVRPDVVFLSLIDHLPSESGKRVDLAVDADEVLALRYGIDLVSKASVCG